MADIKQTQTEQRELALSATRGVARQKKFNPEKLSADDMLLLLDDWSRTDRGESPACNWYRQASDNQIRLYKREHNAWVRWTKNL